MIDRLPPQSLEAEQPRRAARICANVELVHGDQEREPSTDVDDEERPSQKGQRDLPKIWTARVLLEENSKSAEWE